MRKSDNKSTPRRIRIAGHYGEWIQGKLHPEGPIVLISLPCPAYWVDLSWSDADCFCYDAPIPSLPVDSARALLRLLGARGGGRLTAQSNMTAGAGMGASTASLLALSKVALGPVSDETLGQALLQIEGASDPLIHPEFDRLLWASRKARILDRFSPPPAFTVLGGLWGAPSRTDPNDNLFPQIDDLIPAWRQATDRQDRAAVAAIARMSAQRTADLRDPAPEPLADIARELGALGYIRAHTGSARGLLFAPGQAPATGLQLMAEAGYRAPIRFQTGGRL